MPTDRAPDPHPPPPATGQSVADTVMLVAGVVAWGWLLAPLRDRPVELGLLGLSVPLLGALGLAIDRGFGTTGSWIAVVAMALVGFAVVVGLTGAGPAILAGFILGVVKPVGWTGDHLLLRVVPLLMLMAHGWRPSWPGVMTSALGVSAFLGVGLRILHAGE